MLAPSPLPGEVRQSWGFDLIRIQLPHSPGNIQIKIPPSYTGHTWGLGSDRGFYGTRIRARTHQYALRAFGAGAHTVTILIIILLYIIIINFIIINTGTEIIASRSVRHGLDWRL